MLLLGCTGVTSYNSFHVPLRRSSTNGGSSRAALAAGLGGGNAREKVGLPKAVDDTTSGGPGGFLRRTDTTNLPSGDGNADVPFIVLGIETSCDDTGAAIVTSDGEILGEALASQAALPRMPHVVYVASCVCCMLHVASCMLCMLHVACCTLHAACCLLHVA